ncbi:hypothetical protein M011DRAFT_467482 [Sporormia fimetaria CBS 119925]|uniref:Ubiquitin-conjugating enzyme E2 2 n=1 Tax=Sporormia fimetaria CBS 119925 TaxID=1340428 RepID=A0A6A6VCL8_9PLEO|nr:hypothetical protein M011DRAFT_467482 [Sporormia fimetaria CBS 119925]
MTHVAEVRLLKEFKDQQKEKWSHVELINDNIFEWSVALIVLNPDSLYYGGYFKARMTFPTNYPYSPPDFKFLRPLYHPNIHPTGKLCISILHPPGSDAMSGELASERWSPVQSVEAVLLSIISLLDDAEVNSPANVDAGVMLRNAPEKYKERVKRDTEESKRDIPEGFEMPGTEVFNKKMEVEGDDFMWADSDVESFGSVDGEEEDGDGDGEEEDGSEEEN